MGFPRKTEHGGCRRQTAIPGQPRGQPGRVSEPRADPETGDESAKPATAAGALHNADKTHISQGTRSAAALSAAAKLSPQADRGKYS